MKKTLLFLPLFLLITLACNIAAPRSTAVPTPLPVNTAVPATAAPTAEPTTTPEVFISRTQAVPGDEPAQPTIFEGVQFSSGPLNIVIPSGLASGATGTQFPRAEGENIPPWEITPGHTQLDLEGYILQGKFHQPRFYVYPASEYGLLMPAAFESIRRLDNILYNPAGPTILLDQLPAVPTFNAAQVFASNASLVSFQNGSGVRFLTQYAQYYAPGNNYDLIYQFAGLTRDGAYYIIAILPVNAPILPETNDVNAAVPSGGIAFPDSSDPNANMEEYYRAVTDSLNALPAETFNPNLTQLDQMIQSIRVGP